MIYMLVIAAGVLRTLFTIYGLFHDQYMEVKYTDIDYTVFTEAASYVTHGSSPYLTDTYKYTPLLAYLLTPNIYLQESFGKILFCLTDLVVALVFKKILESSKLIRTGEILNLISICWLFNPLTVTISSRGNAESIQILLVLLTIFFAMNNQVFMAGIFYGLSVHFKLYPIIYALPLLLFISKNNMSNNTKVNSFVGHLKYLFFVLMNVNTFAFGIISLLTFSGLGYVMYYRHGYEFIENTYLFHLHRKDFQHNFSAFFYILRLFQNSHWLNLINRLAFLPQFISVLWFGYKYHEKIALACFLQTFAFVTFNKVCTSQYFVWYIGLFPLAYHYMKIPFRHCVIMILVWLGSQGVWLFLAYLLEFKKIDVAFYVWLASLLFLCTNIVLMYQFTRFADKETRTMKKTQ